MKSIRNSKGLYWGLIITFFVLYFLVGFVSTLHSITFFELANVMWMAVLLGITYEVGQAAVLFSILMSDNNKRLLPWLLMILLTALQVTANVYASFKFMDGSGSMDWTYWQRSILFWLEADGPEMFKVIISWITGALLPVVALGMTALVAENLKLKDEHEAAKEMSSSQGDDDFPWEKDDRTKEDVEELKDIVSKPIPDEIERRKVFAEELLNNAGAESVKPKKIDTESGFEIIHEPFDIDLPERDLSSDEAVEVPTEAMGGFEMLDSYPGNRRKLEAVIREEEAELTEEMVEKMDKALDAYEIPADEIDPDLLPNNPKGKKVIKKPEHRPRGWHLKREYVDTNGDIYRYGVHDAGEKDESKKA